MTFVIIHQERISQASPTEADFSPLTRTLRRKNLESVARSLNSGSVPYFLCDLAHLFHILERVFSICKEQIIPKSG